ncbi:MAG: radical SAM protein, pyruvate formate lyase activating enzyme [Candidatus Rokubacteria bacterium CSP1-6]|nr:MAG: radical SAM protein, pyruvate formate lyase activating enzyme [Candidatus Rokubacteria bacterium CSP1-6]
MPPTATAPLATAFEALLWERRPDGSVVCNLCAHRCRIRPGLRGICGVRENLEGTLVTLVADRVISVEVDPIEKKPFFHFLPGTLAYSIATVGCNFHCLFCQNYVISQWPRERPGPFPGDAIAPEEIVAAARATGCRSIAYTYTEPTIFFELALETSRLAAAAGIRNLFVTNGYMTREALALVAPILHGANVDLKSFSDRYYRKVCGATLAPVLETIRAMRELGIWVEVTTLVIPGLNDGDEELAALAGWLASVDRDMPWHVSAFFPTYRLTDVPPTPPQTLHRAAVIGRKAGLRYVYTGNVPGDPWENTACPECGRRLLERRGFRVLDNCLAAGRCPVCHAAIPGVWN